MKLIGPADYRAFACAQGACRHSCCQGWEIDIDEMSLRRYRAMKGPLGQRLQAGIEMEGNTAHFRLTEDERCPFLNADGLCDIILAKGEGALCQICADHPRYRHFYTGVTEVGLGLCCEAAARQTLTRQEPLSIVTLEDDGEAAGLTPEENALLTLRAELLVLAQDRTKPLALRADRLLARCGLPLPRGAMADWAAFLLTLERLEEAWTARLLALRDQPPGRGLGPRWDIPLEQLLSALLCRHLPGALEDGDIAGRVLLTVQGYRLIAAMFAQAGADGIDTLVDIARQFSAEIEYSEENLGAFLDALDEGGVP